MKVRVLKDTTVSNRVLMEKGNVFFPIEKGKVFEAVEDGCYIVIRVKDDKTIQASKDDMDGIFEILTEEEERIYNIQMQTGFDEITIGCFLSNYKVKGVCAGISKTSCKCLEKCKVLEKMGVNHE